jgi:integrase
MPRKRRGKGEGSIFRRSKDGLWVSEITAGYDSDGKATRRTFYGHTKTEVQEKLVEHQAKALTGQPDECPTMRLANALDFWFGSVKPSVDSATAEKYERAIRLRVKPHLGHYLLVKVTPYNVTELYAKWTEDRVSVSGQRYAGNLLRRFFAHCVRLGLVRTNPAKEIPLPRETDLVRELWTKSQLGQFFAAVRGTWLHVLCVLALDGGFRPGELLAMGWEDVDVNTGWVKVDKTLRREVGKGVFIKRPKTAKSRRRVLVSPTSCAVVRLHKQRQTDAGYTGPLLFPSGRDRYHIPGHILRYHLHPAMRQAGLPLMRLHDFRHLSATFLLESGTNVKLVSERLGHSSVKITLQYYAHVLPSMQEGVAVRMDGLLQGWESTDCKSTVEPPKRQLVDLDSESQIFAANGFMAGG